MLEIPTYAIQSLAIFFNVNSRLLVMYFNLTSNNIFVEQSL